VVIAGGEKSKADGLESVKRVITAALDAKIGHNDTILAMGGGALLDVAGYAAAQLRGGVRLLRIPTTPAAMMDAAFATSAAVDFGVIKDALIVPCMPSAVVIDPSLATTVLDGVWNAGFCEAVRFAAAMDAALMKKILKLLPDYRERKLDALRDLVRQVCAAKMKKGNTSFALWSTARLESMSDYRLPHGYAVAIGVLMDSAYAMEKGLLNAEERSMLVKALNESGALDGLSHSQHLLDQKESVLKGLDAYSLVTGSDAVVFPAGIGKSVEEAADREIMRKVIGEYFCASAPA